MARACADDLAVALRSARLACELVPVFQEAEAVAGLRLHTKKCKALVLTHGRAEEEAQRLRSQPQAGAPEWQNFEVVPVGAYLGVPFGRATEDEVWKPSGAHAQTKLRA